MAKKYVIVFGAGNIGAEACRQLRTEGYDVKAVVTRQEIRVGGDSTNTISINPGRGYKTIETVLETCGLPDIVVSAIPGGDGIFETEVADTVTNSGTPYVSAAKFWLGTNFPLFKDRLHLIGRNATVGGGTMMLDYMRRRLRLTNGLDADVHLVINGTMTYFMSNRWRNRPVDAIVRECVALKYAEPSKDGADPDVLELFRGEIDDVIWKLLIVLNDIFYTRTGTYAAVAGFKKVQLDKRDLQRYLSGGTRKKYVVRITTAAMEPEIDIDAPGSITAKIGENRPVYVTGGFYDISLGSAHASWVPDIGPGNAVQIEQGGLTSLHAGDGAGPLATCMSIMHDVRTLCPLN